MPRRVPILGQDHGIEIRHQSVDACHDLVTTANGQRAAGAKVVLHIDHDQCMGHENLRFRFVWYRTARNRDRHLLPRPRWPLDHATRARVSGRLSANQRGATMSDPILALDFGTSNSAAAVLEGGKSRILRLERDADTIPTAIFLDFDSRETHLGEAAIAALIDGREGRFMRALKSVLGTSLLHEKRQFMNERLTLSDIVGESVNANSNSPRRSSPVPPPKFGTSNSYSE